MSAPPVQLRHESQGGLCLAPLIQFRPCAAHRPVCDKNHKYNAMGWRCTVHVMLHLNAPLTSLIKNFLFTIQCFRLQCENRLVGWISKCASTKLLKKQTSYRRPGYQFLVVQKRRQVLSISDFSADEPPLHLQSCKPQFAV